MKIDTDCRITRMRSLFLNIDGIPSETINNKYEYFFIYDSEGFWRINKDDLTSNIDIGCVRIHDALSLSFFSDKYSYSQLLLPYIIQLSGLNSESKLSNVDFESYIANYKGLPIQDINKILFFNDIQSLIYSIQECSKEIREILGEFYRVFNTSAFFNASIEQPDGIRYNTSPTITILFSHLTFIFLRLHSLLDYITKLAFEIQKIPTDYEKYPKLKSSNILFGQRSKLKYNGEVGTLFEKCSLINTIETVRHHLVHEGLLDSMPKGYEVIKDGKALERYILFPDMIEAKFTSFKNRKLFYKNEDKINLRLPNIILEFQLRLLKTLDIIKISLQNDLRH